MRREEMADLLAFRAVAEVRSFTRAAALLGTSQSALSHTVRRLEARLGLRLLTRTTRSVAPSEAGERLLETLGPALDDIDARIAALGSLRDSPSGTVRITAGGHAAESVLWPKLAPVLAAHPDLHLEISVDGALTDIVTERFDAGVRLGEQLARDMIAVRIGPEMEMAVVASADYLAAHGTPENPQALARHSCINLRMISSGGFYAWEFERDGRELKVRVEGQLAFNSAVLALDAARRGMGLAMVLADAATADLASGALVRVLADWTPPFSGYHLYYPSRREMTPALALVVETLRWRG